MANSVAQRAASQRTTVLATAAAGATNGPDNAAAEAGSAAPPRASSTASAALHHLNNTTVQGGTELEPEQYNTSDAPPLAFADACAAKQPASPCNDAEQKDADTVQQTGDAKPLPEGPVGLPPPPTGNSAPKVHVAAQPAKMPVHGLV